jgi:hypothetical protein
MTPANDNDIFQGASPFKGIRMEAVDQWPENVIDLAAHEREGTRKGGRKLEAWRGREAAEPDYDTACFPCPRLWRGARAACRTILLSLGGEAKRGLFLNEPTLPATGRLWYTTLPQIP